MARLRTIQTTYTSGELDPRLAARQDVRHYYNGAERMRNVLVLPQGGWRRAPGTAFVAEIPDAAGGARLVPFAFNVEQTYLHVFTANTIRVFRDGQLAATIAGTPWSGAQCGQINWAQSADTLIVVHNDVQPRKVMRGATHADWTLSPIAFANIPTFDFGAGGEPVISVTRGWPAAVTFHQSRLWLGGLRSRPATLLGSKVGQFFDLGKGTALDDEAIDVTIDSDQVNAIYNLASGRDLIIFTSGAEHIIQNAPITPKSIAIAEQTRRGSKRYVRPVEVDGAQIYVQRGGKALREFIFTELEQAYQANIISLLSPHLILDPHDLAVLKGNSLDAADYVLSVNSDGSVTVLNTLRSQEVTAFTCRHTAGTVLRVAVVEGDVYWLVKRTIAGVDRYFLERWVDDSLTDCGVRKSAGAPFTVVDGLDHLEGMTVRIIADGALQPSQVVTGGKVTLEREALEAEVGLDFPDVTDNGKGSGIHVREMPIEGRLPDGTMVGRRARIVKVTGRLHQTKGLRVNGNPIAFRQVGPVGVGPLDQPVRAQSGDFEVRGLQGWSLRAQVEFTQDGPFPVTVLGSAKQVAV